MRDEGEPLRVVETGTGREEVWFPSIWKSPDYLSLDPKGQLTSHLKLERSQPTLTQEIRQSGVEPGLALTVEFSLWYQGDMIHRSPDKHTPVAPAVVSSNMRVSVGDEYIKGVVFSLFREFWKDGEWENTDIGTMKIIFANQKLNTPPIQEKANEWIMEHCTGGFFPISEKLFGEEDEEFMFLADICSQG